MMINKSSLFSNLAALVCGATLTLAFAPFSVFPLAILAMGGLMVLIHKKTPHAASWLGFWFGVGLFSTGVYWVYISISKFSDVPAPAAFILTATLITYLSCYPGFACYLTNRYFAESTEGRHVFALPALWVMLEWLRCWLFTGFPWLLIGYSQTNSPLKGYAPIFGVYGVSLAVAVSSGLLVQAIYYLRKKSYQRGYYHLLALASVWILGALLSLIPWTSNTGNTVSVSLVQGNIPQAVKWSPEYLDFTLKRYSDLSKPYFGKSKLIVWPEAAIPITLNDALGFIGELSTVAKRTGTDVVLGLPVQNLKRDGYYNAMISVGSDKNIYFKRQLVPFGEYVPFKKWLSHLLDILKAPMAEMVAGKPNQPSMIIDGLKFDVSICYEVAYPELVRTQDRDTNLLLTASNDAWFGHSSAQAQHLQMAAMRAIELKRPLLFVSNDGITASINEDGIILDAAPTHTPAVLTVDVQPRVGLTPWMYNGTDPILALSLTLLYLAKRRSCRFEFKTTPTK